MTREEVVEIMKLLQTSTKWTYKSKIRGNSTIPVWRFLRRQQNPVMPPSNHRVKTAQGEFYRASHTADLLFRFLHLPVQPDGNRKIHRLRQAD